MHMHFNRNIARMPVTVTQACRDCRAAADSPAAPQAPSPRQKRLLKNKRQHQERRKEPSTLQQSSPPPALPPPPARSDQGPALDCPHFASCSGCTLDTGLDAPPLLHEARSFFESSCGLPAFPLHLGSIHGWRHRARLAVRPGIDGQAVIGLFEESTHMATPIPSCVVHHPAINEAVTMLQQAVDACGVEPYDEGKHTGQLRYVQLTVVEQEGSEGTALAPASVQLALVWNLQPGATAGGDAEEQQQRQESSSKLAALADHLWRLGQTNRPGGGPPLLHSVWANYQPEQTNSILGPKWRLMHGAELAWTQLGGADVAFTPGSFLQANREAMNACLAEMQRHVPTGSTIADLHAGVGTIGLSLAAACQPRWVRFVEISGAGQPPFKQSAARLRQRQLEQAARQPATELEYIVGAAGKDPEKWCQGAEVVVCDPPRKGLEPALLDWLASPAAAEAGVRTLLYLSCGFPALRHDAARLLGSKRWRLRQASAYAFFPGANHIETLAVFEAVV